MSDKQLDFEQLLMEAVTKPGLIMKAYSNFHGYSLLNQFWAMMQCHVRGIAPGPINTFKRWKDLGRNVKKGEKAIRLCMPINRKYKDTNGDEHGYTMFVERNNWFVLAQTEGDELKDLPTVVAWDSQKALAALDIKFINFEKLDGNVQGYAKNREIAINPIAQLPHKTMFHEIGHILLGHTSDGVSVDGHNTPKSLREVEAESVALLCCEALNLEGAEFARGYIQHWLGENPIPEKSAQKIFKVANQIIKAGTE